MNKKEAKINLLMLSLMFQLVIYIFVSVLSPCIPENIKYFLDMLSYTVTFGCPIVLYMVLSREKKVPFWRFAENRSYNPVLTVVSALGVISAAGFVTDLLFYILKYFGIEPAGKSAVLPDNLIDIIFYFLHMTILPALCEEILFRGLALDAFLDEKSDHGHIDARNAIIMSSLLFAAMHCDFRKFLYAFCAGLIIGYYVYKSGSVFIGVIIHAVNNTVSFGFLLLSEYGSETEVFIINLIYSVAMISMAAIIVGRNIIWENKKQQKCSGLIHEFRIPVTIYLLVTVYIALREFI